MNLKELSPEQKEKINEFIDDLARRALEDKDLTCSGNALGGQIAELLGLGPAEMERLDGAIERQIAAALTLAVCSRQK